MKLRSEKSQESFIIDPTFDMHRMAVMNHTIKYNGVLDELTDKYLSPLTLNQNNHEQRLPNPLFSFIKANDILLNPKFITPSEDEKSYDIDSDIFTRKTVYQIDGINIYISSERFIHPKKQIIYSKYQFQTDESISLIFYNGINCEIDGVDIDEESKFYEFKDIRVEGHDKKLNVRYLYHKDFRHKARNDLDKLVEHYEIETEKDRVYTVIKHIGIGVDAKRISPINQEDYDVIKEKHIDRQRKLLDKYRIVVHSNDEVQTRIDYALRIMNKNYFHFSESAISPLSLYLMVYAFIFQNPSQAKRLISQEIKKLSNAIDFAKSQGYKGAFYLDHPDKYKEGSDHILNGAMLIYVIDDYINQTDDHSLMNQSMMHCMIEICNFYMDYAKYDDHKKHYAFFNIANIDQSIQYIDYHSLTHYLVHHAFSVAKKYVRLSKYKISLDQKNKMDNFYQKLYLPKPNVNGLIYPYRGFEEDIQSKRIILKDKKVNLTNDQLLIFLLFEDKFTQKVINNNIDYSRQLFSNRLNNQWIQYISQPTKTTHLMFRYFNNVTSLNKASLLINDHGVDIGVCALIYYTLVKVYAGLKKENNYFSVDTNIPLAIRRIEFWIKYNHLKADIKIKRNSARFEWRTEV